MVRLKGTIKKKKNKKKKKKNEDQNKWPMEA
jgi:hypothetical protein